MAIAIGAIGGAIVVFTVPLLDKLRIDDVVGAIPVHLFAGIWGTMAVPLTNTNASFATQAIGVGAIGAMVFTVSLVLWVILKFTIGIRCTPEQEQKGLDITEIGLEAYPEFK
jgi:Amt family ammonium transporter